MAIRTAGATRTFSTISRLASLLSLFVTFAGFVVIVAGLATLQKTTNRLGSDVPAETVTVYENTFSNALLTPYPGNHGFQFSFIWFIIFFELFLFLFAVVLAVVPGLLHTGRPALLALLAVAMTLAIGVVNNLTYLHKSEAARTLYGKKDINVTFAGALLVVLGNGFTILTLGTWNPTVPVATTTTAYPTNTTAETAKRETVV